jgi:hypothetical protein
VIAVSESKREVRALAQAQKLLQVERRLVARQLELGSDLEAAAADAGDAALAQALDAFDPPAAGQPAADTPTALPADAAVAIRASIDATGLAIDRAREARHDAILAVWKAQAADRRRQAKKVASDLEKHQKRTSQLLTALQEHEGCAYVPASYAALAGVAGGAMVAGQIALPMSQTLAAEYARLEAEAQELETRRVHPTGQLTATSVDALVDALYADAMRMAPREDRVRAWAERAREALLKVTRTVGGHFAYTLTWSSPGVVDEAASTARRIDHEIAHAERDRAQLAQARAVDEQKAAEAATAAAELDPWA